LGRIAKHYLLFGGSIALIRDGKMKQLLNFCSRTGVQILAKLTRHQGLCWRYTLWNAEDYVGDILFEPRDNVIMELRNIEVERKYRGIGIGSMIFQLVCQDWKEDGYKFVEGCVVAHEKSYQKKLVEWYEKAGATVSQSNKLRIVL